MPLTLPEITMDLRLDRLANQPSDIIGCEPEVWKQILNLSGGAEAIDAQNPAVQADIFPPADGRASFNGNASPHCPGQNALAVGLVLGVKNLCARHGHEPNPQSFSISSLYRLGGEPYL
jgi:hypothetical protein